MSGKHSETSGIGSSSKENVCKRHDSDQTKRDWRLPPLDSDGRVGVADTRSSVLTSNYTAVMPTVDMMTLRAVPDLTHLVDEYEPSLWHLKNPPG